MLISQVVFIGWVFISLVSNCSLVFQSVWPIVEQGFSPMLGAGNLTVGLPFVQKGISVQLCDSKKNSLERDLGDSVEGTLR